jgi:protein-arginine kinase activator protein McsA
VPTGQSCNLCEENDATIGEEIESEETGELVYAYLCEPCHEKLIRYNRGEEVNFDA